MNLAGMQAQLETIKTSIGTIKVNKRNIALGIGGCTLIGGICFFHLVCDPSNSFAAYGLGVVTAELVPGIAFWDQCNQDVKRLTQEQDDLQNKFNKEMIKTLDLPKLK